MTNSHGSRETAVMILDDAVDEILLLRIAAQILKRQYRAEPGADPPLETVAAGKRTDDAGIEDRLLSLRAPLVGQLTLVEVRLVDRQR